MSPIRSLLAAACRGESVDGSLALDPASVRRARLAPLAHTLGARGFDRDHLAASLIADRRRAAADQACAALAAAGVPVLLLKGIAYAGRLYADPAARPMTDVDLLVAPDAIAAAARALARLGYWDAGEGVERSRFHHGVTLKRPGGAIDLHRAIRHPLRAQLPGVWPRAERAHIAGALVPSAIDEAVIGLALIARQDVIVPAINLVDAARLLSRVERDATLERARRAGLGRPVAAVAHLADVAARGEAHPWIERILSGAPVGRLRQLGRKVALSSGPLDALRLAANAALASLTAG